MKNLLDEVGAWVERITVTALRDGTFFAEIVLNAGGEVRTVSSRPSDAIALAIRIGSPIRRGGRPRRVGRVEQPNEEQAEQMVEEFREFIDHVQPRGPARRPGRALTPRVAPACLLVTWA